MAGRTSYIIATPDNENHETAIKGGKVPTFATWANFDEAHPHPDKGVIGWRRIGWSYQATKADAAKKALPDLRKGGVPVTVTRVLPASL